MSARRRGLKLTKLYINLQKSELPPGMAVRALERSYIRVIQRAKKSVKKLMGRPE